MTEIEDCANERIDFVMFHLFVIDYLCSNTYFSVFCQPDNTNSEDKIFEFYNTLQTAKIR